MIVALVFGDAVPTISRIVFVALSSCAVMAFFTASARVRAPRTRCAQVALRP